MGPQVIAIAPERAIVQSLLTRLRAHKLRESYLPWPTNQPGAWPPGISAAFAVAALPILAGHEMVTLLDLLDGAPALNVAVVAGHVTDEPDTIGLFASLAARSLVVDLRGSALPGGARTSSWRDLPRTFWDQVIELAATRQTGRWEMTDDGMLVAAPPRPPAETSRLARALVRSGDDALSARAPLDGAGRIR